MALTRKYLKGMGLTDEQVDTIIEAHSETVDGLKADIAKYKQEAESLPEIQKELDGLKSNDWKEKYDQVSAEFKTFKADTAAKELTGRKKTVVREMLKEAKIPERRIDSVLRLCDLNSIELDESGSVKDKAKHMEKINTEFGDYVETSTQVGADTSNPPVNNPAPAEPKTLADALKQKYATKG